MPDAIEAAIKPKGRSMGAKAVAEDLRHPNTMKVYLEESDNLFHGVDKNALKADFAWKYPVIAEQQAGRFQTNLKSRIHDLSSAKTEALSQIDIAAKQSKIPKLGRISSDKMSFEEIKKLIKERTRYLNGKHIGGNFDGFNRFKPRFICCGL